jgi:hypothetical protein
MLRTLPQNFGKFSRECSKLIGCTLSHIIAQATARLKDRLGLLMRF